MKRRVGPKDPATQPGNGAFGLAGAGLDLGSCDTLPSAAPRSGDRLAAGSWLGTYQVEGRIGVGGTCEVYCARERYGTRAAIRVPRRTILERSPCFGDRLIRTSLWLRRIEHPNLVRVLDHGITDEAAPRPYQIVELVDGEGLDAVLLREGARPWRWVVGVVIQLAEALDRLHRAGYVHCDVKPANAMLVAGEAGPQVKLLDCDLAWRIGAPKEPGVAPGTPRYIPPEHALGVRPTRRTDVYALGVLAVELLLGRCPFGDSDFLDLLHSASSWPVIGDIAGLYAEAGRDADELPAELRSLLRRMTSPQRRRRPRNMRLCVEELRALVSQRRTRAVIVLRERAQPRRREPSSGLYRALPVAAGAAAGLGGSAVHAAGPRGLGATDLPAGASAVVTPAAAGVAPIELAPPAPGGGSSLLASVGKVLVGVSLVLGLLGAPQVIDPLPERPASIEQLDVPSVVVRPQLQIPERRPMREAAPEEPRIELTPVKRLRLKSPRLLERQRGRDTTGAAAEVEQAPVREPLPRKKMPRKRVPLLDPGPEGVAVAAPYVCPENPPATSSACIPADPHPTCIYNTAEGLISASCVYGRWRVGND
jgi:serine/threonine protein kinase